MYEVKFGGKSQENDRPIEEIEIGEIGVITSSSTGDVGGVVIGGFCQAVFIRDGMYVTFPPRHTKHRFRPLRPGESVTFTRTKD